MKRYFFMFSIFLYSFVTNTMEPTRKKQRLLLETLRRSFNSEEENKENKKRKNLSPDQSKTTNKKATEK